MKTQMESYLGYEVLIHNMPFDSVNGLGKTQSELEQMGVLVDNVPEPQIDPGKAAVMFINPDTKEISYDYRDIPKTQEQL